MCVADVLLMVCMNFECVNTLVCILTIAMYQPNVCSCTLVLMMTSIMSYVANEALHDPYFTKLYPWLQHVIYSIYMYPW